MTLTDVQARVLGALIEKEISTPDIYPLSLNALRNACNQSSSREPVMNLDEEQVRQAVHVLQEMGLADANHNARVAKFEHRARHVLDLRRDEIAVFCLLLLRGPQTPGELRGRADRMYTFDGTDSVLSTLNRLAGRPEPLCVQLPRAPGAREARWAQTLTGVPEVSAGAAVAGGERAGGASGLAESGDPGLREEVETLREELASLRLELAELRERVGKFEQLL